MATSLSRRPGDETRLQEAAHKNTYERERERGREEPAHRKTGDHQETGSPDPAPKRFPHSNDVSRTRTTLTEAET